MCFIETGVECCCTWCEVEFGLDCCDCGLGPVIRSVRSTIKALSSNLQWLNTQPPTTRQVAQPYTPLLKDFQPLLEDVPRKGVSETRSSKLRPKPKISSHPPPT